ncbi:MAG TPA: pyrrolo-quinoline quinone [Planctomycetaceae bacterium]|nr:pyrrolo-quinoline quinone [Planctomycetaceae bacterium]
MSCSLSRALTLTVLALACCNSIAVAEDWPQWMGPDRDGRYTETGVIESIPAGGLKKLWSTPVEVGYSGPAVVGDKVYVTDYVKESGEIENKPSSRDKLTGRERVLCLDAKTGKIVWEHSYKRSYAVSFGAGPRATPTVDGDHVFILGTEGDLTCLDRHRGKPVWHKSLVDEFPAAEGPIWGHSAHPLVVGDKVFCLGGPESVAVALDRNTGETIWQTLTSSEIGYCPPAMLELGGKQRLMIWHPQSINALDPETGEVVWTEPLKPSYGMSIAAPQLENNYMYASGIGNAAVMLQLNDAGQPTERLWEGGTGRGVYAGNATPIFSGGMIFGSDCGSGKFLAVDAKTGEQVWETYELTSGGTRRASHGTAFVVKHPEQYFIFTETGDLVLADLNREGFKVKGRVNLVEPTNSWQGRNVVWTHPAYANRCIYVRNDKEIACFDLSANQ